MNIILWSISALLIVLGLYFIIFERKRSIKNLIDINPQQGLIANKIQRTIDESNTQAISSRQVLVNSNAQLHRTEMAQEAERLLLDNKITVIKRASELGVPYDHFHQHSLQILTAELEAKQYLLKQQVELETKRMLGENELKLRRMQREETIRFALTEAGLHFEKQNTLVARLRDLRQRREKTENDTLSEQTKKAELEYIDNQIATTEAELNAIRPGPGTVQDSTAKEA